MEIKRRRVSYGLLILMGLSNFATVAIGADTDQVIVQRLLNHCRQGAYTQAKLDLTQDSYTWLDRWAAHDVNTLIPSKISVSHQEVRGDRHLLWLSKPDAASQGVSTSEMALNDSVIVVLQAEAGHLKVDIPESMKLKFGADWADTADVIESGYSLAVGQLGKTNSRAILESLLNAY